MININRYFGRSIRFSNGLTVGFNWMHGNGESSRTIATLASYHPPSSITWLWAIRWFRPKHWLSRPFISRWGARRGTGTGGLSIGLPFVGAFGIHWQTRMERKS